MSPLFSFVAGVIEFLYDVRFTYCISLEKFSGCMGVIVYTFLLAFYGPLLFCCILLEGWMVGQGARILVYCPSRYPPYSRF